MALEQLAPQLDRILPPRMSQFIDKAFHGKGILRAADGAPEPYRHMRVLDQVLDAVLGKAIGHIGQALDRGASRCRF